MICYLCGLIQDYHESGLCCHCQVKTQENNQRMKILALLSQAKVFLPMKFQEDIEKVMA